MVASKLPIWDGRVQIGEASSMEGARRAILKLISVPDGFHPKVWERSPVMQEILDLPPGYVFAISNKGA